MTFQLSKYSRSYPPADAVNPNWQHYTNPIISLSLETAKTELGTIEAMKLCITWTLPGGDAMNVDPNAVTFVSEQTLHTHICANVRGQSNAGGLRSLGHFFYPPSTYSWSPD